MSHNRQAGWFSSNKSWGERYLEMLYDYFEDIQDALIKRLKLAKYEGFKTPGKRVVDCLGPKGEKVRVVFDDAKNGQVSVFLYRGENSYETTILDLAGSKPHSLAAEAFYILDKMNPQ